MTQSIEYVVKVNGAAAAAGQVATVEESFRKTDAAAAKAGSSIDAATKPTRNVGRAAMEAARAIEDLQYGFNGVVNNIPSLVMGLGAGAGLAGAISLVAIGVNQLIKNWDSLSSALGSSEMEFKAVKGAIAEVGDAFNDDLNKRIKAGREELQSLKDELRDFGLTSRDKTLEGQYRTLEDLERRRDNIDKNRRFLQAKANAAESAQNTALFKEQQAILNETDRRRAALDKEIAATQSRIIEMNKTAAAIREKERQEDERKERETQGNRDAKKAAKDAKDLEDFKVQNQLDLEEKAANWLAKIRKDINDQKKKEAQEQEREDIRHRLQWEKEIKKRERDDERARKRAADERIREHKKMLQEIADAEKKFSDYAIGLGETVTGQLASNLTDYLVMKAEGEKDAEQKAVASFLSATGKQLVASGVKGVFEGAIMSANPLTPGAGAGMIATGGAAIVAGMAMAGGGAAIAASLPADTSPTSATRDPGASPRGSSLDSGGGGPMIINVSYGAGGPLPEDIAREIGRVVNSGNRRRGAA